MRIRIDRPELSNSGQGNGKVRDADEAGEALFLEPDHLTECGANFLCREPASG